MISEFCTKLAWGGFAIVNRIARLLIVSVGVDEVGHTNAIHDILVRSFL
jgi:hypothetical protein